MWTLAVVSGITIVIAIFSAGVQTTYCKPFSDAWNKTPADPSRNCRSADETKRMIIATSGEDGYLEVQAL
jgi:hypothetical protein